MMSLILALAAITNSKITDAAALFKQLKPRRPNPDNLIETRPTKPVRQPPPSPVVYRRPPIQKIRNQPSGHGLAVLGGVQVI